MRQPMVAEVKMVDVGYKDSFVWRMPELLSASCDS